MSPAQVQQEITSKLKAILEELGVDGFVMAAYLTTDAGRTRIAICSTNSDAAVQDGLRAPAAFCSVWANPEFPPAMGRMERPPPPGSPNA